MSGGAALGGSVALIIGGASGLGRASAEKLHSLGAHVVIGDVNADAAAATAAEIGSERSTPVSVNVADWDSVTQAVAFATSLAPRGLRYLVNTAGIVGNDPLVATPGEFTVSNQFERMIGVNLLGTFNVLRAAATVMSALEPDERGERGVCINTASIAAYEGAERMTAYAASKAGVAGLTLPAARELSEYGIRVVAIAPGWFATSMTEDKPGRRPAQVETVPFPSRFGRPDEYADLVEHIIANQMLNGSVLRLDAALRLQRRSD